MCRFVVYSGREVLLADLIIYPKHSLINQSFQSQERFEPLNGDGFGVGWYNPISQQNPESSWPRLLLGATATSSV